MSIATPRDMQFVLDLLVKHGWAESAFLHEQGSNKATFSVNWTPAGRARITALRILVNDLERDAGRLQAGEFEFLDSLISIIQFDASSAEWPKELPELPPPKK